MTVTMVYHTCVQGAVYTVRFFRLHWTLANTHKDDGFKVYCIPISTGRLLQVTVAKSSTPQSTVSNTSSIYTSTRCSLCLSYWTLCTQPTPPLIHLQLSKSCPLYTQDVTGKLPSRAVQITWRRNGLRAVLHRDGSCSVTWRQKSRLLP